jgi:hypothetical protein
VSAGVGRVEGIAEAVHRRSVEGEKSCGRCEGMDCVQKITVVRYRNALGLKQLSLFGNPQLNLQSSPSNRLTIERVLTTKEITLKFLIENNNLFKLILH